MPNTIKLTPPFFGLLLLLASTQAIGALPGESIVLDPNTGDYTLTYWDYPGSIKKRRMRQAIFVPATKIYPLVKSSFKLKEEGVIVYNYLVTNGLKSRQALEAIRFDPVTDIVSALPLPKNEQDVDPNIMEQVVAAGMDALTTPNGWNGGSYTSQAGGLRISWSYSTDGGLAPGKSQGGFGFSSTDIPGIGIAQLDGNAPVPMFPAEGPAGELAKEFDVIEQNNFVSRNAAVPTIAVPVPFDAAILLDRIRTHVATWPGKQLLDPALAAQLERYLVSAADAYRRNQLKAGKEHIETLREMLEREHKNLDHDDDENENGKRAEKNGDHRAATGRTLIDRLAARVLDFDLKYALKRMEREETESKK